MHPSNKPVFHGKKQTTERLSQWFQTEGRGLFLSGKLSCSQSVHIEHVYAYACIHMYILINTSTCIQVMCLCGACFLIRHFENQRLKSRLLDLQTMGEVYTPPTRLTLSFMSELLCSTAVRVWGGDWVQDRPRHQVLTPKENNCPKGAMGVGVLPLNWPKADSKLQVFL